MKPKCWKVIKLFIQKIRNYILYITTVSVKLTGMVKFIRQKMKTCKTIRYTQDHIRELGGNS